MEVLCISCIVHILFLCPILTSPNFLIYSQLQQYLGCSKITGISDLRWSAAKAVLSLLRAVNDTSHKVGNDTSDNEGCGGNLHSGCPSVHIMRRAKRRFGASSAHSQYATTSLVNRSQRESVNLFAVQQPFASTLEWGTTVKEIEGAATCVGEMKSCGEFKISLIGCVVELIAKLTAMYMEVGAVATRDSNLQLVTVCQIAQELMYISPDRIGDFSFGLFRWMNERQPNSRMANLPNAQGVCAIVFEFIHFISSCHHSWLVCHVAVTASSSSFLLMI